MENSRGLVLLLVALGLVASAAAFNPDRTIYKWSPLWFNNYYRRANLFKRFRDEPIQKWSPMYFDKINEYLDQKRTGASCGRENSMCVFISDVNKQPVVVRCCGNLQCLFTGSSYTCTDPKTVGLGEGFSDTLSDY
ncbi:uncharacterized protein LOC122258303 [Penaeus japonicus]|uniref:uncharacterized protein LOC122258303 n=1 Tax=Penaeus japonicus TaxID=27405 RepID=UPI001C713FA9|nr:uncharacterized protein LOC122258303 [Penaeus japonicus]